MRNATESMKAAMHELLEQFGAMFGADLAGKRLEESVANAIAEVTGSAARRGPGRPKKGSAPAGKRRGRAPGSKASLSTRVKMVVARSSAKVKWRGLTGEEQDALVKKALAGAGRDRDAAAAAVEDELRGGKSTGGRRGRKGKSVEKAAAASEESSKEQAGA